MLQQTPWRQTDRKLHRQTENRTDKRKEFIKYRYLVLYLSNKKEFLKSNVRTAFDTDHRFCLSVRPSVRTDGQTKVQNIGIWCHTLPTKKRILKIRRLELILEGEYGQTDGYLAVSKPTFHFLNSFELKKESRLKIFF